jgi:hypothetical protein
MGRGWTASWGWISAAVHPASRDRESRAERIRWDLTTDNSFRVFAFLDEPQKKKFHYLI